MHTHFSSQIKVMLSFPMLATICYGVFYAVSQKNIMVVVSYIVVLRPVLAFAQLYITYTTCHN